MKSTRCATLEHFNAKVVDVEASLTKGLPSFSVVGMVSTSTKESLERVKSALLTNAFSFPPKRITINLSPSEIKKEGSQFDLAIALLLLMHESNVDLSQWFLFGELGLDGRVKNSNDLFTLLLSLSQHHREIQAVVPYDAIEILRIIPGITVYGVRTLQEAYNFLTGTTTITPATQKLDLPSQQIASQPFYINQNFLEDFSDVRGQTFALRAALIAAAGNHNLLLEGSPGSGKSMIAKRLRYILPPLSHEELLITAKLQSLQGKTPDFAAIRAMKSPHHSATVASIFGGGSAQAKIGEMALANRGLLFFDELPHFGKSVLEALREPLEDRQISISRAHSKVTYETDLLFIAAMNPCPCGNLLDEHKECRCSDVEIQRYKNRLSDPLLERIELYVQMRPSHLEDKSSTTSTQMYASVGAALGMRLSRHQQMPNANISVSELNTYCTLDAQSENILATAATKLNLSFRTMNNTLRVARTIADLNAHQDITKEDLIEALNFRRR